MKHWGMRTLAVGVYIIVMAAFMRWNLLVLFDIRMFLLFAAGVVIYAFLIYGMNKTPRDIRMSLRRASYPAGLLYFFLLTFYQCYGAGKTGISLPELALNLRPILYAFILSFLMNKEEKSVHSGEAHAEHRPDTSHQSCDAIYFGLKEKGLTEREIEVTNLIRKGLSNYEIAEELYIAEATVKKHVTHIFEKLNVSGRKQMIETIRGIYKRESLD